MSDFESRVLLAIDTSTAYAGVAFLRHGKLLAEHDWEAGRNHSVQLLPALNSMLAHSGITLDDVGAVVVAQGPGSFNGLRVGIATAKGLAYSLQIPIVAVTTLEVEAYQQLPSDLPICAIHDAGRKEIAVALFHGAYGRWERRLTEHITKLEALLAGLTERTLFCGEIPEWARPIITETLGNRALLAEGVGAVRRAGVLADLGWRRLTSGHEDDLLTLQPLYLRRPTVES
ncbi:MAG: tRNA (adenosine(37)-N6)-threonylcarbamoyltransferase complex dimerization subunit type 1 TsaB [Dehalococcoidia bacterium]|nr:tRNA (adenosine(37)-N6)-threonylcarbamoyltransferase complex dimerization subunit type 1 TsaB [Dehalococcoidia bacterium]